MFSLLSDAESRKIRPRSSSPSSESSSRSLSVSPSATGQRIDLAADGFDDNEDTTAAEVLSCLSKVKSVENKMEVDPEERKESDDSLSDSHISSIDNAGDQAMAQDKDEKEVQEVEVPAVFGGGTMNGPRWCRSGLATSWRSFRFHSFLARTSSRLACV